LSDNPNESNITNLSKADEILGQLGVELAFVTPNQDTGLLPINRFVMDLEELAEREVPFPVTAGLKVARAWLDQTLDGPGKFTEESIRNFNGWHTWMTSVLLAWERGTAMPAWPEGWNRNHPTVAGAELAKWASTPLPSGGEETSIRLNLAEDLELLREFHGESVELLHDIEQGILVLEDNPADAVTINSIFRAFHTFKGGAGFLKLEALRDLAHDLESLLDAVRRSELRLSSEIIDLILAGADALKHFTREIGAQLQGANPGAPILVPTRQIIGRVQSALRGEPPSVATPPAAAPSEASKAAGASSAPTKETSDRVIEPKVGPTPADATRVSVATSPASGFVKLDTAKLDNLVDIVGELVIAQSMVVQNPDVQKINSLQLVRCLRQLSRITTELQRNAMSLRMVPIRAMFHKMNRLVRDLSTQQQKLVRLVLEGEETELDRNIVEKLGDPLAHMIRNAVDHGLEYPADRVAKGKPDLGTIRLSASHQRGGIVIRIQDDGRGLNRRRILAKAMDRELVKANANLSESEIFSLIFLPGFSTAEKVTDLSGRGVGMDVVRRNIESLRGKIEIQSLPGQGTTFTILLPLTLAIIDGLLVGVGGDRYIIPTLSIRESFRPRPGMVSAVHEQGEVVSVRGRQTPLLRLSRYLGTTSRAVNPEDGIIVVVESGDSARGLLVDELIGKQEVVIKSLGGAFEQQNLLAGGAVLGDGWVGLILDVDTLVKMPNQPPPAPPTGLPSSS
jgi:two-component system, chemotaxis family, sensor kinase CheA